MIFLGFRVTHQEMEKAHVQKYYLLNIENYLKVKQVTILRSSLGLHKNSTYPHIHYNFVIEDTKLPKVLLQDWKYNYSKNNISIHYPDIVTNTQWPCLWTYKCGTQMKINISIQSVKKPMDMEMSKKEEEADAWLQYPFKEKYPIKSGCRNVDIKKMTITANTLYLNALKMADQKEKKKTESLAIYTQIQKIIVESQLSDYNDIIMLVLDKGREFEKPIHFRKIAEHVQTICYRLKIIQIEDIATKFYLG